MVVLSPSCQLLRTFPNATTGATNGYPFDAVTGVALDGAGHVYVADCGDPDNSGQGRVVVLSPDGELLYVFPNATSDPSTNYSFTQLLVVDVDSAGRIHVGQCASACTTLASTTSTACRWASGTTVGVRVGVRVRVRVGQMDDAGTAGGAAGPLTGGADSADSADGASTAHTATTAFTTPTSPTTPTTPTTGATTPLLSVHRVSSHRVLARAGVYDVVVDSVDEYVDLTRVNTRCWRCVMEQAEHRPDGLLGRTWNASLQHADVQDSAQRVEEWRLPGDDILG